VGEGLGLLHRLRVSCCAAAWYQFVISGHSEIIFHPAVPWKHEALSGVWVIVDDVVLEFPEWGVCVVFDVLSRASRRAFFFLLNIQH